MADVPLPEPYGRVTMHTVSGMEFFYRHPDPPYLDMATSCTVVYTTDALHAHAAAVSAAARDCRTCSLFYDWEEGVCTQSNKDPCTNADKYEPLPPVRLWRTT